MEKSILVCKKIEEIFIKPNSRAKCSECGAIVGITKASEEAFADAENKEYLCLECFEKKRLSPDDEFVPITKNQAQEINEYLKKL